MTRGSGTSPVIIVGMHRPGTGMLAGKLQDAGLFLGWRQQVEQANPELAALAGREQLRLARHGY